MLTASDIMTRTVHSVSAETSVEDLARIFIETKVSTLPVVDAAGRVEGIVTETDLVEQNKPLHIPTVVAVFDWVLYLESEKSFQDELQRVTARKVGEICSRDVVTCTPETPLPEIARLMSEHKVHLLPVVAEGLLVGVVARLDMIRAMGR